MAGRFLSIKTVIILSTFSIWILAIICIFEYLKISQTVLDCEIQIKTLETEYDRVLKDQELKEENLKQEEYYDNIIKNDFYEGPGEYGVAYSLDETQLNDVQKLAYDEGWKNYEFNSFLSDMISIERKLDDLRDDA